MNNQSAVWAAGSPSNQLNVLNDSTCGETRPRATSCRLRAKKTAKSSGGKLPSRGAQMIELIAQIDCSRARFGCVRDPVSAN